MCVRLGLWSHSLEIETQSVNPLTAVPFGDSECPLFYFEVTIVDKGEFGYIGMWVLAGEKRRCLFACASMYGCEHCGGTPRYRHGCPKLSTSERATGLEEKVCSSVN